MLKNQCFMLNAADKVFYTDLENQEELAEFCRIFNIKTQVVNKGENKMSTLKELATGFCNTIYKSKKEKKNKSITSTEKLREFIISEFKSGNTVSLKSITNQFSKEQISIPTIYNHLKKAKEILAAEGYRFRKVSVGNYQAAHLTDN